MNTEQFTHVPYCVIKNNNIIKYNKEFEEEFDYPKSSLYFAPFELKSEQKIKNDNYILYNVGDENETIILFFNKNNIPDLKFNTKLKDNLTYIHFGDEYLCYNVSMDNAHMELCKLINSIINEYINEEKLDDVVFNLLYLLSTTKEHFLYEELLMDNLPIDFTEHKTEHFKLIEILTSLLYNLNAENIVQSIDYLKGWLLDHILIYDKKLGEFVKNY